jgi:hypothetical protein
VANQFDKTSYINRQKLEIISGIDILFQIQILHQWKNVTAPNKKDTRANIPTVLAILE